MASSKGALPQEWRRALKVNKIPVVSNAQYIDLSSLKEGKFKGRYRKAAIEITV